MSNQRPRRARFPKAPGQLHGLPHLGYGIGLRTVHFAHILSQHPPIDWFEIISENYIRTGGRPMHVLDQVAERYPIVMHGVSMSIASTAPVDFDYLRHLKALAARVHPHWVSDHLCWTGMAHRNTHDLLPVPYNEAVLKHVCERIRIVQDFLERPLVLENPSTYLEFKASTLTEWDFLAAMARETGCGLLLDVNNVYVSSFNHGFDPEAYIRAIPHEHVVQYHLAGHTNCGTHIIDTHDGHVIDRVWDLYRLSDGLSGGRSTLLEWDDRIPSFDVVHEEALKAQAYIHRPGRAKPRRRGDAAAGAAAAARPASQTRQTRQTQSQQAQSQQAQPPSSEPGLVGAVDEMSREVHSASPRGPGAVAAREGSHAGA